MWTAFAEIELDYKPVVSHGFTPVNHVVARHSFMVDTVSSLSPGETIFFLAFTYSRTADANIEGRDNLGGETTSARAQNPSFWLWAWQAAPRPIRGHRSSLAVTRHSARWSAPLLGVSLQASCMNRVAPCISTSAPKRASLIPIGFYFWFICVVLWAW